MPPVQDPDEAEIRLEEAYRELAQMDEPMEGEELAVKDEAMVEKEPRLVHSAVHRALFQR